MTNIQAVLKSARNYQNKTVWEAFYVNGEKVIENYFLDETALIAAFELNDVSIIRIPVYEKNLDNFLQYFPDEENFSHLFDNMTPIKVGQRVYVDEYVDEDFVIEAGVVTIKDIYSAPNTNMIWEKSQIIEENQIWFTCNEIPGVFYWNRLYTLQNKLAQDYQNQIASLKERKS